MARPEENEFRIESMLEFPDFSRKGFDIAAYNERFVNANYVIHVNSREVSFPTHWGPLGIKCAFGGSEFYKVGNGVFAADQDKFLVLNNGTEYSSWIDSDETVESLAINFSPSFEDEVMSTMQLSAEALLDDPGKRLAAVHRFTERLYSYDPCLRYSVDRIRCLSRLVYSSKETMRELLYGLVEDLARIEQFTNREINAIKKNRPSTKAELFRRLVRARDFIYSCYADDLSLEVISRVACLNEYYFLREFKRAFGITPHRYLTHRRLEVASQLIASHHHTIGEVCMLVGFNDPASFSKLFKKQFGVTPFDFRMSKRQHDYLAGSM